MTRKITVSNITPIRLDKFLFTNFEGRYSRNYLVSLLKAGNFKVNNQLVVDPNYLIKPNDILSYSDQLFRVKPLPVIQLPIIYQDEAITVINKPAGVLSHAKGQNLNEPSVASFIQQFLASDYSLSNRAGIVHRLDRATSGVMLTTRTEQASKYYANQFKKHYIQKAYLAVTIHRPKQSIAAINLHLARNPKKPSTFRIDPLGKTAQTTFEVIANTTRNGITYYLLLVKPKTGRTHQIRVHLAHIGLNILGDPIYSIDPYARLMLHAYSLSCIIADKGRTNFIAEPPLIFNDLFKIKDIIDSV